MISLRMRLHATLVMVFCLAYSLLSAQFAGGTGTESDPWLIKTRAQLELLNNYLGQEHTNKHYRQIADINLGDAPWNPIGRTAAFYGEYDGDGYRISNLYFENLLNGPSAFFITITNATIENTILENVNVYFNENFYGTNSVGYVAALAIHAYNSTVDNCHASGNISISVQNGGVSNISGFIVQTDASSLIQNCSSCCSVGANSDAQYSMMGADANIVAGLVCHNYGMIIRSGYSGDVSGHAFAPPDPYGSMFQPAFAYGIAGIASYNYGSIIECYNHASVSGFESVGGITGENSGTISKCYSSVSAINARYFGGGIAGRNTGTINNCWARNDIYCDTTVYDPWTMPGPAGGLLGNNAGTVTNSYAVCAFPMNPYNSIDYHISGLVGSNSSSINSSYWDMFVSNIPEQCDEYYDYLGEGRYTDDMTYPFSDSTYVDWDFTNIWKDDAPASFNNGYPILQWQTAAPQAYFSAGYTPDFYPTQVTFHVPSNLVNNGNISYWWNFGDGQTSTEAVPTHTYQTPGIFTVSLTITSAFDSISTFVRSNYISVLDRVPILRLDTSLSISFGSVCTEEISEGLPVTITSVGGATLQLSELHFLSAEAQFQIQQPLPDLNIPHLDSRTFMLRFAPLYVGSIVDTLYIVSNAINEPLLKIRLSGTGLYVPPQTPQNLTLSMDGVHANLGWDPVTHNTHNQSINPDYYFVYFNGSDDIDDDYYFLGLSPTTQYTHMYVGLGSQHMFYRVRAIKLYRTEQPISELDAYLKQNLKQGMSEAAVNEVLRLSKDK